MLVDEAQTFPFALGQELDGVHPGPQSGTTNQPGPLINAGIAAASTLPSQARCFGASSAAFPLRRFRVGRRERGPRRRAV